jgi:hypothetical protein
VTRSEEPVDLDAIAADDAMVERLRASISPSDAVVWGDDDDTAGDGEDLSYALLRALQLDVSAELDDAPAVLPLVTRRRAFGRTATVAALTAGVLSLAGAAAAATSSPGDPMYGVRSAVASAVHDALDAITPSEPAGSVADAPAAATPTVTITPRGTAVSATARSVSAARQIEERLATADRLLDRGRATAAGEVLDQAERRLPLVLDAGQRSEYQRQIDALRARALATPKPPRGQQVTPREDRGKGEDKRDTPKPSRSAAQVQRGQGGQQSPRPAPAERGNSELRLPQLPSQAQAEEHGAPRR